MPRTKQQLREVDELDPELAPDVRLALATWPQIDPQVEGILDRVDRIESFFQSNTRRNLARVGLTKEEFKVVMALAHEARSHGALCRELGVSTGAMTNRADKLERRGLLERPRDPNDRRGVLLSLTADGRKTLDSYIDIGAENERQLLDGLSVREKKQLNTLLQKTIGLLGAESDGH